MIAKRSEVAIQDQWDLKPLYKHQDLWNEDYKTFSKQNKPLWPEIASLKGRLNESPTQLAKLFEHYFEIERKLHKLYTYAHLRMDENLADDEIKKSYTRSIDLLHNFAEETAWIEPEILALPEKMLQDYLQAPELTKYSFHLEKIVRLKPHTLSTREEELLALSSKALSTSHSTFSALNNADFKFGSVVDSQNNTHELTHASYHSFIRSQDRVLRKNAFELMHGKYASYENTLGELLKGSTEAHLFHAKARNYSSCLEAALFPNNIDVSVYHALIRAVESRLKDMHRYLNLRKKLLHLDSLHVYDLYVPLMKTVDIKMSYLEAEEAVIASAKPLGTTYHAILAKGLQQERWVDRYENENKRSGAYSSGCYDSHPYILMNFKENLRDVFTLAHEAGHSMHSHFSKEQPYLYHRYPIFLAEVASTLNEDLLMHYLLEKYTSAEEKAYLINEKIEDIRATLFRQTMFAEFELKIHELAQAKEPLTPGTFKKLYEELNRKYYGPELTIDPLLSVEWARIPHFYYNFYVYQYATGLSAALYLSNRLLNGGPKEQKAYLQFLKSGGSRYPIETLKLAGVDMKTEMPVLSALDTFSSLVDELERLLEDSLLAEATKENLR
jgi:oligoendopeptidase F